MPSFFPAETSSLWDHQWRDLMKLIAVHFCRPEEFSQLLDLEQRKKIVESSRKKKMPPHIFIHGEVFFKKLHVVAFMRQLGYEDIASRLERKWGLAGGDKSNA